MTQGWTNESLVAEVRGQGHCELTKHKDLYNNKIIFDMQICIDRIMKTS